MSVVYHNALLSIMMMVMAGTAAVTSHAPKIQPKPANLDPDGSLIVQCLKSPCLHQKCGRFPDAVCVNNYCGRCYANFYINNTDLTLNCTTPTPCPDGSQPVNCSNPPCPGRKCLNYPEATCVNDHCKGCNARFYVGNTEVTNSCGSTPRLCPDGSQIVTCMKSPCSWATCGRFPDAVCVNNYCGRCYANFYINNTDLTLNCTTWPQCPDGSQPVNCSNPPCPGRKCLNYPEATCVNDHCKGCNARFYVGNTEVTNSCGSTPRLCPDGSQMVTCMKSPCSWATCGRFPDAVCVNNFCGGCFARFYVNNTDVTQNC